MSLSGKTKKYKFFNREKYQNLSRYNKKLTEADCMEEYELKFSRLPECEAMTQQEYRKYLMGEYSKRKNDILKARKEKGKGFMGEEKLKRQVSGSYPVTTKTSMLGSYRPLYLSLSSETLATCLSGYFSVLNAFKLASYRYRKGHVKTKFPPGTFRPSAIFDVASSIA